MRMRPLLCALLLCVCANGPASAQFIPDRFADGSLVPENADYTPPKPIGMAFMRTPLPRQALSGTFEADVVVAEDGAVLAIEVKRHLHPRLDRKLAEQFRQLRYRPATLDGKPVAAIYRAEFTYGISNRP